MVDNIDLLFIILVEKVNKTADKTIMKNIIRAMFGNSGTLVEGCAVVEDIVVLVGDGETEVEDPEATAVTKSAVSV